MARDRENLRIWRAAQMHKERDQQKRKRAERIAFLKTYRVERGCMYCGEKHPACLDFHHRDPSTKLFNIASNKTCPLNKLIDEVAKCDILCANCHRKEHYREGQQS